MPESNQHSELRGLPHALWLDAEWRKQETHPQTYRFGKHVYPPKVVSRDLHEVVDALRSLEGQLEAERKMREIDQRQCDDMTDQAGRLAVELADLREQLEALTENRDLWRRRAKFYGELHDAATLERWVASEESSPASSPKEGA